MPPEIAVNECFQPRHLLPVFFQQPVWTVVDAKVLIDALALDIGVVAVKIDHRMAKVVYRHAITTEGIDAVGVS